MGFLLSYGDHDIAARRPAVCRQRVICPDDSDARIGVPLSVKRKSAKELLLQQDMGLCTHRKLNMPSMVGTKLLDS